MFEGHNAKCLIFSVLASFTIAAIDLERHKEYEM
jgi:hypothetical protein